MDSSSEQITPAPTWDDQKAIKAAEELAEAFATIEKHQAFLPADVYNPIASTLTEWIDNQAEWMSDPAALRAGLSGILTEFFLHGTDA